MNIGARLRRRWYLVIVAAIVGVAAAGASLVKISSKGIHETRTVYKVAAGELLIDTDPSTLTNVTRLGAGLAGRAALIAEYSTGPGVINDIAKRMGVPVKALTVQAQSTSATKTGGSATKNVAVGRGAYSVLLRASSKGQTIGIFAQAHSKKKAKALVAATISAVRRALTRLQASQPYNKVSTTTATSSSTTTTTTTTPPATTGKAGKTRSAADAAKRAAAAQKRKHAAAVLQAQKAQKVQLSKLVLRQLGSITASTVVSKPKKSKAVEYGVGAFLVLLLLILLLDNVISGARRSVPVNAATRPTDD